MKYILLIGALSLIGKIDAIKLQIKDDVEDAEAILLVCTDLPTINIINQLEDAIGKPVITSNQASFWATIRSIGLQENTTEFGRLLAEH